MNTATLGTKHFTAGIDNIVNFVDELTYINYRHNRKISPSVSAERWERVYGPNAPAMEARYQAEGGGAQ